MKAHRDLTIWAARFSNIRLHAFGIAQVLPCDLGIEIYQARCSPELWRARPQMQRIDHKWEAASAEALKELIASDFETCQKAWYVASAERKPAARPSLTSHRSEGQSGVA